MDRKARLAALAATGAVLARRACRATVVVVVCVVPGIANLASVLFIGGRPVVVRAGIAVVMRRARDARERWECCAAHVQFYQGLELPRRAHHAGDPDANFVRV